MIPGHDPDVHTRDPIADDGQQRRRLQPEERRDAILDAALAAFAEVGYGQATLNDVADRLGVTKGCLYHYFESKEQLLAELVRHRLASPVLEDEEWAATVSGSREEVLRALLERIWQHLQRPGQVELAVLVINQLPNFPQLGRVFADEVVARSRETLRRALLREFPSDHCPEHIIERAAAVIPLMIFGVALGHHVFRNVDPMGFRPEDLGRIVTGVLLHGVGRTCTGPAPAMPTERSDHSH